jgi:hypothetical protein
VAACLAPGQPAAAVEASLAAPPAVADPVVHLARLASCVVPAGGHLEPAPLSVAVPGQAPAAEALGALHLQACQPPVAPALGQVAGEDVVVHPVLLPCRAPPVGAYLAAYPEVVVHHLHRKSTKEIHNVTKQACMINNAPCTLTGSHLTLQQLAAAAAAVQWG